MEIRSSFHAQKLLGGEVVAEHDIFDQIADMIVRLGTQQKTAQEIGISGACLHDILVGKAGVGKKLPARLGYERVTVFVKR